MFNRVENRSEKEEIRTITDIYSDAAVSKREEFTRMYSDGLLTADEMMRRLSVYYGEQIKELKHELKEAISQKHIEMDTREWKEIDDAFLAACGLKKVAFDCYPADLGFDEMNASMYMLRNRIDGLDELYSHPDPAGKFFALRVKLNNRGGYAWVRYNVSILNAYDGEDQWQGYRVFEGFSEWPGYHGEVSINIRQTDTGYDSVAYQKVYEKPEDPIWKTRRETPVTYFRFELADNTDIDAS